MTLSGERPVIGSTSFKYKGENVSIRVLAPTKEEADWQEFSCKFSIDGSPIQYCGEARGIDSMQALILALTKIGTYLQISDEIDRDAIEWANGPLEFPVFRNLV